MKRLLLLSLLVTQVVIAQDFLPPESVALSAISQHPEVVAATAQVRQASAEARGLDAGEHELQLSVIPQRREIRGGPNFHEYEGQLTRAIRLPGKARLDRQIGQSGSQIATLDQADAEHQVARDLLLAWMEWLRSGALHAVASADLELLSRDREGIARRVALGDAAQRDLDLAEAALAQSRARQATASGANENARLLLEGTYPQLVLPQRVPAIPAPLQMTAAELREQAQLIIDRSHEIASADTEAQRLQQRAARARADRMPDPTVGFRYLDEGGGEERVYGLVLSIPLGSRSRSAHADAQFAAADAGDARARAMQRDITTQAKQLTARTDAAFVHWQQADLALASMQESARKNRRAYELGELDASDLILSQRLQHEAATDELQARAEAVTNALLIRIDTHELWHAHEEDDPHHHYEDVELPDEDVELPEHG